MPRLRLVTSLALAATLAGCTALLPSETASPAASVTPSAEPTAEQPTAAAPPSPSPTFVSAPPTPTPTGTPVAQQSTAPSPTSTTADGSVNWHELNGDRGLGDVLYVDGMTSANGRLVAVGEIGQSEFDESYVIWTSDNGTDWTAVNPPIDNKTEFEPDVYYVTATRDGFLAGGDVVQKATSASRGTVWLSSDGLRWDEVPVPFAPSPVYRVGDSLAVDDFDGTVWTSDDGRQWQQHQVATTSPVDTLVQGADPLLSLTQAGEANNPVGPVTGWTTTDGVTWAPTGWTFGTASEWPVLSAASDGPNVAALLRNPKQYSNARKVWTLGNGQWASSQNSPQGAWTIAATSAGFAAVGDCTWPDEDPDDDFDAKGVLWTSPDGQRWSWVGSSERGAAAQLTIEFKGKLIGLGRDNERYYANHPAGAVWVADLPPAGLAWPDTGNEPPTTVCEDR